jgi:hypothetical protein
MASAVLSDRIPCIRLENEQAIAPPLGAVLKVGEESPMRELECSLADGH